MKSINMQPLPAALFCVALLSACGNSGAPSNIALPPAVTTPPPAQVSDGLTLRVLSNRADLISGGDALVEIVLPHGKDASKLSVERNGVDVSDQFALRANGRIMGVVTGLVEGRNLLKANIPESGAKITIVNHPNGGPIFSGPQMQPWYCLPGALDTQCNRPTTYAWFYQSTDASKSGFQPYDPNSPAADVAMTKTDQDKTVPYIVRVETGNMNRSQYRISVLADPTASFDRWTGPSAWNHKVYVPHGAGCTMGHKEGPAPDVLSDIPLSRGFSVMSTSLSDNSYSCNLVVQAESIMMAKEHLVEAYGDVRYQMGLGCSGGSIASLTMANAYPGLYDGLVVGCTMPEVPVNDLLDCKSLLHYFETPTLWSPGVVWPDSQQAAATGMASTSVCHTWVKAYHYPDMFDPRSGVGCGVTENVYDPATNPGGVRCSFADHIVNLIGLRAPTVWSANEQKIGRGFAGRTYDNVGVQYGWRALMAGDISPAQFADLNAKIGSMDIDYVPVATRAETAVETIRNAYVAGVMNGASHLDQLAIIDIPGTAPADRYEIHDITKSWGLRARLDAAFGNHENNVLWYGPDSEAQTHSGNNVMGDVQAFQVMDEWLTAVENDTRNVPRAQKIAEGKPPGAQDRCDYPNRQACDAVFGPSGNPRYASGEKTIANDVIKCQLKPLDPGDYAPITFTEAQWAQLQAAFPTGVCDVGKPGVEQQPAPGWMDFTAGPGGEPLPAAPVSQPLR